MQFDIDTDRAKAMARAIQNAACPGRSGRPSYTRVLEGIAHGLGYRDWNTLSADLRTNDREAADTPEPRSEAAFVIPGTARDNETGEQHGFNARRAFDAMSDSRLAHQMQQLLLCDFQDDPATERLFRESARDRIVLAFIDRMDETARAIECSLDGDLALSWCKLFRPAAWAELRGMASAFTDSFEREFAEEPMALFDADTLNTVNHMCEVAGQPLSGTGIHGELADAPEQIVSGSERGACEIAHGYLRNQRGGGPFHLRLKLLAGPAYTAVGYRVLDGTFVHPILAVKIAPGEISLRGSTAPRDRDFTTFAEVHAYFADRLAND